MKNIFIRILLIVVTLFWMGVIFYFSNQTGEESSGISTEITNVIIKVFVHNYSKYPLNKQKEIFEILSFIVRKGAHFTIFAILGLLLFLTIKSFARKDIIVYPLAFLIGVVYAISDEFHQSFVNDRAPMVRDVLIDSLGVFTMLLLIAGVCNIIKIRRIGKKYD